MSIIESTIPGAANIKIGTADTPIAVTATAYVTATAE